MEQSVNGTDPVVFKWGLIQIYTGKGKGKTTAALGTALRAHANNKKVCFIYFDKGGQHYSERKILDKLGIEYHVTGLDRIDPITTRFRFGWTDEDKAEAARGLRLAEQKISSGAYDLIVLDEINVTAAQGALDKEQIIKILKSKPDNLELILTGRDCPQEICDAADLVTEMALVKHYFYKGIRAREGLDY